MTGYYLNYLFLTLLLLFNFATPVLADEGYQPSYSATPSGQIKPTPSPSLSPIVSQCRVSVVRGNNSLAPAEVVFKVEGTQNSSSFDRYSYDFGDGSQANGTGDYIHKYSQAGTYVVTIRPVVAEHEQATTCTTSVTLKAAPLVAHRSECTNLMVDSTTWISGQEASVRVTGYDNKGEIQGYKIVVNGNEWEDSQHEFLVTIPTAGSYQITGYIKDSTGVWIGSDSCIRDIQVKPMGLTTQPDTGVPTWFWITIIGLGVSVVGLSRWKIQPLY